MAVRLKTIESKIKNIILEIKDDIDESLVLHNSFLDLGINSVLSVDLIENINQEFNIDVGIDVVFDYRGVKELAEYIYTEYSDEMNTDKEKEVVNIADKNSEINKSDIAIIGISGRFADSDTIEEFWQHLQEGDCCIDEITRFDWDGDKYSKYHPLQNNDNRKRWGAMLKEVDKFDPLFFNISPLEAERMDPQQRLFIEEAYKAFEDGGYSDDEISGKNIGVFVGGRTSDYKDRTLQKQSISSQCFLGNDMSILAGRISYFFNLKGPSIAVDTACSSSLMAIHLACESIHKGEVEMALAGGVFVTSSPEFYYMASDTGMLSPNGKCKTFDNGANGIVVGEGVGALILKPLEKAMNDGDNIYGVIKGSAVNQDGRTKGITAPSMLSQKNLIYQAYKKSSINPETISYVEAHGTGTKLGDPIEVKALNEAFSMFTDRKHFCVLGSHKPNFGHTIMTAGIAGVFKILMGMKYKKIPPTISVEDINEHIDLDNSPFYINTQLQDWKRNDGIPLRAGVSSFGFSGTNCHMIIEEPPSKTKKENSKRHPFLFPFSAKTKTALRQKLIYMNEWLDRESDNISIQDISYTLLVGRKHFTNRCIIIASDLKELKDKIEQVLHNEVNDDYFDNTNRDFSTIDGVTKNTIEADYILDKLNKSNIDKNEYKEYLTTLAKLYTNNHELDWTKLFAEDAYYRVSMPGYPFDKESYWIQEPEQKEIIKDDEHEVDSMMVPTWDMNVISSEEQFPSKESNIVIIGGNKQVISKMMKQYPNGKVSDINASDNINDIINKLESYDLIEHIIVINSNESLNQLASDDEVGESYGEAILVFRIIKALINLDYDTKNLGLTFITKQSQGIHKDEKINPVYASIHGLIGSLAKEYSNWNIRLVDLEADEQNWPIDSLFYLPVDSQGNPLAYRNGEWYKQKLVPIHQSIPVDTTAYKQGGVYVVIGGAGGIGEVWSEYVIKNYQAKVIWIGRREKDELIQSKIDRLAKLGEKPYYISADATKLSELEQAYKEIKKQYDCINGVIHSAIVLHDSSLANMDEDSFREGLSTKLYISIRMVQVFKKENLDFIMFFSSIMSFTKNAGQSNYASGCTFNDAFAHRLSSELSCAVKVINWGYWGSVGIVASEKYRDRMAQLGYASIEPEEAMKTLELLLNSKFNQIVYMKTLQSFELDAVNKNKVMNVYPPRMDSIVEKLQSSITEPEINISDVISGRNQQMDSLNELLYRLLWKSFKDLGLLNHTVLDITEMKKKINLPNMYDRWFEESISLLAHYDCLSYDGHKHIVINQKKQHHDNVWEEWENKKNIWLNDRDMKAMVILAEAALAELPRILTGQIPATDVIFPDSSIKLVEGIYKNNTVADYYNEMIGNLVVDYIENRRKSEQGVRIRIIEIGAGTGGTTSVVLKKLEAYEQYIEEYCYTDISKLFLINAGERFSDYLYLKYEIFNVEQPIALQNINEDTYDIVIGTNVFHATKNIRHSLRNAKAVLKTNGVIMLNEINNHNIFNHLTFGLLDGWWRYEDKPLRIKGCPNLSGENWERILEWEGFRVVTFEAYNVNELGQQIIIAESDGIVLQQLENTSNVQHENNTINQFKTVNADYNAPSIKGNFTNQMILDNVKETITDNLSKLLKIDINRIDKGQSFADYGLDSITGIHLIQSINQELKTELKTTNIFDYSSVNRLAGYIVDKYKDILNKHYGTSEIIYDDTDITSNNIISTNNVSKDIKVENSTVKMHKHHEIAIIGMSGQFPKSKSVEELWEHLVNGEDLVEEVTRWDLSKYYEQEEEYCNHGGFLEDIDYFDPLFFNISGIEATYMDTQQRLFLEECWNGLEDAGYVGESIKGRTCGVFAGYHGGDYPKLFGDNPPPQSMWGNAGSMISSRIAYYLDLQGPAITVDTACSSSLVAIHLACQNLRMGETEMALAGGVFVQSTPDYYLNGNRAGMLSIKGRCHTFDESADGFVWGEGAGVVVLKRLEDAIKDGDHIYGVIKGSGINQDGKTNGITAPSSKSQERLERYVYDTFNINPEDIQMIEAHGTGTILGDPIEYEALTNAFRSYTDKTKYCSIGSIKTNMGHASAASGVAGLIKILMSLKYKQIPPSLHYKKGNTKINFDDSPFFVNKELSDWKVEQDSKCCAAISAFGFSGTNAHVVIEEAPENTKRHNDNPGYLIVLSARTFQQLQEQVKQLIVHCEQTQELDLGNISYTLLMGRKHFNHRLAYVAQNKTELINQLGKWLEKGQGSQIFVGQKDKSTLQPLLKQYGNECIESCKDSNANEYLEKLSVLANMFIQGYKLNFGKLFDNQYQRISLPTYPFNKEKYWVPEKDNCEVQPIKESNPTRKTKLHPLLHENTSDFWEQRFSSTFTGQEFFLDHHRVGDNKILPGVAYLEMVRVAVSQAANVTDELIKIKNVVWIQPVIVNDDPVNINIRLYPKDDGEISYEIYSLSSGDNTCDESSELIHSQGTVAISADKETRNIDINRLQETCDKDILSSNQCYETFSLVGMNYKEGHKGIDKVYVGNNEVLAKLVLPSVIQNTCDQYILHPCMMDSALQASIGLMLEDNEKKLTLPFTLEEVKIHNSCTKYMWAYLRNSGKSNLEDSVKKIDIDLCDENGKVCVSMKGYTYRTIKEEKGNIIETENKVETLMFQPIWDEAECGSQEEIVSYDNHIVMFCGFDEISANNLENKIDGAKCINLELKESIEEIEGSKASQGMHIANIPIQEQYTKYMLSAFNIIKRTISNHTKEHQDNKKQNTLIQIITKNKGQKQLFSGLSGLLKTAGIESTRLIGQMIQIETDAEEDIIKIIKENSQYPENKQISYQNGKRHVKRWEELSEVEYSQDTYLKQDGVYLITGGAGGLGLLFAEDIIKKAKGSRIILAGRSPLNNEKKTKLEKIRKTSNIQYKQVDVTDKDMVDKLIKEIKEEYGRLDGIIHSAGIIKDNYIIKKTEEEIKQVMQPKVTGLINLDLLTKDISLDFFILFSSISGVVGNLGQADYAAANAYMDAYATYRNQLVEEGYRKGHTLAINWPMWKNGGMKIDEETEKMMEKNMGMTAMENRTGIEAFYKGLALDKNQVMVIEGNSEKIRQKINKQMKMPIPTTKIMNEETNRILDIQDNRKNSNTNDGTIELDTITNKIQTILKQIVSNLLQVKVEDIDTDTKLNEYGFDSITFTKFANNLNQKYNLELTPTIFFEYSTIYDFTQYLIKDYRSILIEQLGEAATTTEMKTKQEGLEKLKEKPQEKQLTSQELASQLDIKGIKSINHNNKKRFINRKTEQVSLVAQKSETKQEIKYEEKEAIAIVGISGIFPMARNLEEFWNNLEREKDCITEIPKERWDWKAYYGDPKKEKNKTNIKWGGFIDGIDEFDPMFFSISPKEAMLMDPQQRLLMMYVWKVIEDAGYSAIKLSGTKTGIFVGTGSTGYNQIISKADVPIEGYTSTGTVPSIGPNRMSYYLDIHGPSEPIETACSSSLVAIHRAVVAMQNSSCDMAIAGGVNTILTPDAHIGFSKAGMLSEDGRCKTFSDKANGYARGEGAGMIMLKRLKDAEEAGDHIYGIIKGTAENHGGRANSLTAPNPKAQAELIKTAYEKAGINPRTVTYIEAHGTGTELGDPIEINGLKAAFEEMYEASKNNQIEDSRCGIGSVKTNIGHLELAAGIAGVIKVLLQMKHKTLVKSLHCETINPYIKLEGSPFYIVNKAEEWKTLKDEKGMEIPRRAGISSFGFGGVNAHVLIEEYKPKQEEKKIQKNMESQAMIILSAKTKEQLKERAEQLLYTIKTEQMKEDDLQKIAYTLQVGRQPMEERLGIIVKTLDELKERLNDYIEGKESVPELFTGESKRNKETLAILAKDEEIQEAIEKWIKKKKYTKLLDLWTKGLYVDWDALYRDNRPQKISLPTYPFAKKSCWVPRNIVEYNIESTIDSTVESTIELDNVNDNKEISISNATKEKPRSISLVPLNDKPKITNMNVTCQCDDKDLSKEKLSIDKILQDFSYGSLDIEQADKLLHKMDIDEKTEIDTHIENEEDEHISGSTLQESIIKSLTQILYINENDIDIDDRFIDMGMDSITGVEWIQTINRQYGLSIKITKIYDYPSVREFAKYIKKVIND